MIDKDAHTLDPPLKRLGVPVFDLGELREREGSVLGRGAFGVVRSIEGYPGLAVKEIRLDGLGESALQSLRFELTTLTTLTHPGILRCHQIIEDEDGDLIHVIMDRHDTSLETLIMKHRRRKEPVPTEMTVALAAQIVSALVYLHGFCGTDVDGRPYQGVVHRDLKPANILVSEDGNRVVLADFGLCRSAMTSGTTRAGSPAYMAPETLLEGKATPASDIWALGVIIYELATLKRPNFLEGKEPKDVFINGWKPDLSDVKNDFIRAILERIFVLNPEERPTARDLCKLLRVSDVSVVGMKLRVMMLEEALNKANGRIASLERELQTKSSDICALKNTITTQTAEIDSLKSELKTKSNKINALEQQLARAIEALEKKTRQRETEMDQQLAQVRAEADQHKKELEALKLANEHADKHDEKASRVEKALTPEVVDDSGVTALMKAAARNDVKMVRALIPKQRNLRDGNGKTALMYAAQRDCKETVKILLEYEKRIRDNQNHNALYHALKSGHMEVAKVIIPHEDPTDENGVTALMRAAGIGDVEAVRLLIPLQKEIKDKYGNTAFVHALKNKHIDVATLLRKHEAPSWTLLMYAAATGDIELAKSHLSDKDKKNGDGDTALMIAARAGHENIVKLLDPTDERGVTALMRAAEKGDVKAVRALIPLQKGKKMIGDAYINGLRISNGTALMMAAAHGHTEVVKLLVEHESGMQDKYGKTALIYAAENGHTDCIKLLVEKEAGMRDNYGWTALMNAAENNNLEHVKLLLEKEGGMKNSGGYTALMIAIKSNNVDCVRLLAKKEGHIKRTYKRDNIGYSSAQTCTETALDIAKANRCKAIIAILSGGV
ncbi:Serine/threonine protein kinase [Giardia duodenalis]|uniref:Serine/threonine protein kinase n=1 Tax=Giardia intestinalis TaxID=5741 RepID=V6U1U9_GIAIN|nr:Serine/threonine protein kinase [Giardia intestinalis]